MIKSFIPKRIPLSFLIPVMVLTLTFAYALGSRRRDAILAASSSSVDQVNAQRKAPNTSKTDPVPAYIKDRKLLDHLPPTLSVKQLLEIEPTASPIALKAYQSVLKIPRTIAQLPCYCYCDEIGHSSLLSCFMSAHAAHCAVCQREALQAYRWQKQGLNVEQIRNRMVASKGLGGEARADRVVTSESGGATAMCDSRQGRLPIETRGK